jgi:membrane-associated phospholipid phosphatase
MDVLIALLWPLGVLLILAVAWSLTRGTDAPIAARVNWVTRRTPSPRSLPVVRGSLACTGWVLAGSAAVVCVMTALGAAVVVHQGHVIDTPIYNAIAHHQAHTWSRVMARTTKIGNTWTTWGAGLVGAACLAVAARRNRWLPLVAFVLVIVVDHYATIGLRHIFERPGPPGHPHGTYPSGGVERVILFYGLVAYFLWREFRPTRHFAVWSAGIVGALAYNEAYSRIYLGLHWFTDGVSGLLYGALFLAAFIVAVRVVAGPAEGPVGITAGDAAHNGAATDSAVKALA